jgi:hypothetical protein
MTNHVGISEILHDQLPDGDYNVLIASLPTGRPVLVIVPDGLSSAEAAEAINALVELEGVIRGLSAN